MNKLIIAGDFYLTQEYLGCDLFADGILEIMAASDYNILNLECPISDEQAGEKISKTGPHLRVSKDVAEQLSRLKINAVTLANNHILDYGEQGVRSTLETCLRNHISHAGAGMNIQEASRPLSVVLSDNTVTFINACENEWSIASARRAGANPLDIIDITSQIKEARLKSDFIIVILHGGHECYPLPSPRMVKQYRFLAENGADAIIGHHTHCVGGYEIHKHVPIVYSLGNMLFTKPGAGEKWNSGLLANLQLERGKPVEIELLPIGHSIPDHKLDICSGKTEAKLLEEVEQYSMIIRDHIRLEDSWNHFIDGRKKALRIFSPLNLIPGKYLRAVITRILGNRLLMSETVLISILNLIRCESHRDVIIKALEKEIASHDNSDT